jgi:hypothetical protein
MCSRLQTSKWMEPLRHGCPITEKVAIGVSRARFDALKAQGKPVPAPIRLTALVDTGAAFSLCDPGIIAALELESIGTYGHWGIGGQRQSEFFRCSLYLDAWSLGGLAVASERLREAHNFDLFLGRDILQFCLFTFDPRNCVFSLSAPNPGFG